MARLRRVVRRCRGRAAGCSPFLEGEFDRVVAAFQDALNMAAIISPSSIGGATAPRRSSLRYGGPGCRALLGRGRQAGTALRAVRCRLLPQKQVYCCSAVSEVMGHFRTTAPSRSVAMAAI